MTSENPKIRPSRAETVKCNTRIPALLAVSLAASTGCQNIIDTAITGYPISQEPTELREWAKQHRNQETIETITINGLSYEFIGINEDRQQIEEIKKTITDTSKRMPIQPATDVTAVVVILNKEDTQTSENSSALTPKDRINGVQYIIINGNPSDETVAHELVHGVYQTTASKDSTDFIGEGVAYEIADPIPNIDMPRVEPAYLMSLEGIFREDGNITKGFMESDTEYLQINTMRVFWHELEEIDPEISYRLLQLRSSRPTHLKDIPDIIIANASPDRKTEVEKFISKCNIFKPTQRRNLLVIPNLDDEGTHPEIMVYYYNVSQLKAPEEINYWYRSEINGTELSNSGSTPRSVRSNEPLEFTKSDVDEGFSFTWTMEDPSSKAKEELSFKYENGIWKRKI
ncbi:MAG: hypothetical protein ACD_51C00061G0005 [uncultured bacterium]|nr:MAG: hypothetical protein ACD_51C00061G0005 [uncultured bacterium]OGJ47776.1 MAG: hypothetical protein A2244_03985 [Candidatus Peregrinibacteria bacterium RIFOXYA2_FULL_41_18]OGJ52915.1 MAG: hypothetical protein A2336_04900 [Candidatus Peregrinibacteria bacterium RIFOXYB2_FULL_41_88]